MYTFILMHMKVINIFNIKMLCNMIKYNEIIINVF